MSSCCVAPESSLYLTFILPSARMLTTTGGVCCCGAAPPTVGRLTMEGATSGAVTMKMTSSTSMTSMYGTTLMSAIARRERPPRMLERLVEPAIEYSLMRLALQNVRKLFDEGLEADREAIDVVCVAIVGDHGRDRGEQADRGRRQRFGNAGRDVGERRLLHVGEAAEGVHDPPHRTEQADIRADRADGREEREVGFEHVHFPLERGAHRTAGAVGSRPDRSDAFPCPSETRACRTRRYARARRWCDGCWRRFGRAPAGRRPTRNRVRNVQFARVRRIANHLRKMNVHDISDSNSRSAITACASTLALRTRVMIERSCALFI